MFGEIPVADCRVAEEVEYLTTNDALDSLLTDNPHRLLGPVTHVDNDMIVALLSIRIASLIEI
jgi:hypothetical protein